MKVGELRTFLGRFEADCDVVMTGSTDGDVGYLKISRGDDAVVELAYDCYKEDWYYFIGNDTSGKDFKDGGEMIKEIIDKFEQALKNMEA